MKIYIYIYIYKTMFGLIKKVFIGFLTGLGNGSKHTKCISISNQKCMIESTLLIYILMNTVKNYTILHLQLN